MKLSISVADRPSPMPQIMFSGNLENIFSLLEQMGYEGVDLFFPEPEASDAHKTRQLLDSHGLKVTMLAAQGDLMKEGLFLNRPQTLPRLLEKSRRHLEMCAALDAMPNVGFLRGRIEGNREESLGNMSEGLKAYCELAGTFGLKVLLEPICRYEINSILTVDDALDLCDRAENPENLYLLLDLFHMNIEESSILGAIGRAKGRIGHVHFVDNTRAVPGHGCQKLGDVVECLAAAGYDGFLGLEAVPGRNPEKEARSGLACCRALLSRRDLSKQI